MKLSIKLFQIICFIFLFELLRCKENPISGNKQYYNYFPMKTGNSWTYYYESMNSAPYLYEDGQDTILIDITGKDNDSTYICLCKTNGTLISRYTQSNNSIVTDTEKVDTSYKFYLWESNERLFIRNDNLDLEQFTNANNVRVIFNTSQKDTLYVKDSRGYRNKENYLSLIKNVGLQSKFRDEGFGGIYHSWYLELINYSLNK